MTARKSWFEQLKDPRWQKKRLEIMNRDRFECICCGEDKGLQLHVHHTYYGKGKAPWEYPDDSLETLCEECHKMKKDIDDKFSESLKIFAIEKAGYHDKNYLRGIIDGNRVIDAVNNSVAISIELDDREHVDGVADALRVDAIILEYFIKKHNGNWYIDIDVYNAISNFCNKYKVSRPSFYSDPEDAILYYQNIRKFFREEEDRCLQDSSKRASLPAQP